MTVKLLATFLPAPLDCFQMRPSRGQFGCRTVALWPSLWLPVRPMRNILWTYEIGILSSGVEGALILVAALIIAVEAIPRLLHPQPLENVGRG